MELLLNLVWGAVIAALWGLWLTSRRGRSGGSVLPGIGIQIVGLAMLSAILLPVISVTDDLELCQNPAEVERSCIRNDRHLVVDQTPHGLPVALALLALWSQPGRLHTVALIAPGDVQPLVRVHYRCPLWSRPPPAV